MVYINTYKLPASIDRVFVHTFLLIRVLTQKEHECWSSVVDMGVMKLSITNILNHIPGLTVDKIVKDCGFYLDEEFVSVQKSEIEEVYEHRDILYTIKHESVV